MSARSYHVNSDDDVARYLRQAVGALEAAAIPDELAEVAFAKAVDLFAAKQLNGEDVAKMLVSAVVLPNGRPS